jgi:hypothetical protein
MELLDLQTQPLEAAHRAHRMMLSKLEGGNISSNSHTELYPGFESEANQKDSLSLLLRYRHNIHNIIYSANEFTCNIATGSYTRCVSSRTGAPIMTGFICYNREYDMTIFIQQKVCVSPITHNP